jgi:Tol biopolymer transport system component
VIRRPTTPITGVANKFSDVYIADLGAGAVVNLTNRLLPAAAAVAWSPVDDRLLIWEAQGGTAWFESSETAIHLFDLSEGRIDTLTSRTETTGMPFWSPDGSKFAVVVGDSLLRIRWLPGMRETSISLDQQVSGHITWAPDGNALIAVSTESSEPSVLIPVPDGASDQVHFPVAFDGNWPNVGLQWSSLTPPGQNDAGTSIDQQ